jgi:hypothetical protein
MSLPLNRRIITPMCQPSDTRVSNRLEWSLKSKVRFSRPSPRRIWSKNEQSYSPRLFTLPHVKMAAPMRVYVLAKKKASFGALH